MISKTEPPDIPFLTSGAGDTVASGVADSTRTPTVDASALPESPLFDVAGEGFDDDGEAADAARATAHATAGSAADTADFAAETAAGASAGTPADTSGGTPADTADREDAVGATQPAAAPEPKTREWVLEPGEFAQLPDRAVQELWFELRTWSWKSLALVPTVAGSSEMDVAEKLVVVGVSNTNRRMTLISAEGVTIGETDRLIAMIRGAEARGDRVIVVTDALHDNPAAAPIIRAVNGAILSVRIGASEKAMVERTISTINRNRVIGVITREP